MKLFLLVEGYGRVYGFQYDKFKQDPHPKMLILGKYRHPNTRNLLLGGLNLNYLSDEQILELRKALPEILRPKNLKMRYRVGSRLLPDIFDTAYRTYDRDWVGQVTRDTLKFYQSPDELDQAELGPQPVQPKGPTRPDVAPTPAAPEPAAPEKALDQVQPEEPSPEKPQPESPEVGQTAPAQVEPEVEKTPAGDGLREPAKATGSQTGSPPSPAPEEAPEEPELPMTSAQKRRHQAQEIKKAIDQQKTKTPPPTKPEPPEEMKDVLGMFKKPK